MRPDLKTRAIRLRKSGYLYAEIARELGVAKSTAYSWTYDQVLSPQESKRLIEKLRSNKSERIKYLAILKRAKREERDRQIQQTAAQIVGSTNLTSNHRRLLCSLLFWCEGAKSVAAGITFINSDPIMIRKFLELFRSSFKLDENKFRALVHLHEYHDVDKQQRFWAEITGIPLSQFHRPYLKPNTGKNTREGYPGCISIRYFDSALGKLLKMIYIEFSKET